MAGFACAAAVLFSSLAQAQQTSPPADDSKARIEQLEKEVQALKASIEARQPVAGSAAQPAPAEPDPNAVKRIIDEWSSEKAAKEEEQRKADEQKKRLEGTVVGDDLQLIATWDAGGFRFKTADEAFSIHFGGRLMPEQTWWTQSPALRQSPTPPANSPLPLITGVGPGIGDLQDGFFIRRVRLVADGTIYQTAEFKMEVDFENYNSLLFDESYIGMKDLPFIDTVRIGQEHVPFGLEAYTSSRFVPTIERSPLYDAFYQEFAPGIFTDTTFLDQRITTQHMFHRIDNFSQFNGASFGDGKYAYSGRVSALPIYEDDGRCLLHLGLAYQFRKGSTPQDFNGGTTLPSNPNPAVTTNTDLFRFRVRADLRDAVGQQGDSTRVIDTGNIIANDCQSVNGEFLMYSGSAWVQSEACLAHVDDVFYPASKFATPREDLNYYGTYIMVGYFLTGDKRGYDKRMGKPDRVRPLENFFLVRDEDGHVQYGWGAWEIVYRYAYTNLNDDLVRGGTYGEHTIGLNWYWNSNIKFQLNYIDGQRIVPAGAASGVIQGFALLGALEF
jgi:phosphate-selective porin OprO/OprP